MSGVPSSAPDVSSEHSDASPPTDESATARLRGVVAAIPRRCFEFLVGDASTDHAGDDRPTRDSAVFDMDREGYPDRDLPLTHPGRDQCGVNTTDVVAVETDAGLRLSVPEHPGAAVVSDLWVEVEE